jgi:leucyl/phenylalanyl-tRNA--protein transferase
MRFVFRVPHIVDPRSAPYFPDPAEPVDEWGLVAVGGVLTEPVLLEAYSKGIFPWYDRPPILWYSPDPRSVLYPDRLHLSRRLARTMRQGRHTVRFDSDFEAVIRRCASVPRPGQSGTWISGDILRAYTAMHERGYGHSVEVYREDLLVGGLYGLSLGAAFFGESMFSLESGASKIAFYHLCRWARAKELLFIDCQVPHPHLSSLGAEEVERERFLAELASALAQPTLRYNWSEEAAQLLFPQTGD